jgi:hypothetical protein
MLISYFIGFKVGKTVDLEGINAGSFAYTKKKARFILSGFTTTTVA